MAIFLPRRWKQQPQRQCKPKAISGLRNMWVFNPQWDWRRCLISGKQATLGAHAGFDAGFPGGLYVPCQTWTENPTTLPLSFDTATACTILIGFRQVANILSWSLLGSEQWRGWYFNNGVYVSSNAEDSGQITPDEGYKLPFGMQHAACSFRGVNDWNVSVNGGTVSTDTSCAVPQTGTISKFSIGGANLADYLSDTVVEYVAVLDRGVTNAELKAFSEDFYGEFLVPERRVLVSLPSSATVPTLSNLTVNNITSSGARHNVTLTF